MFAPQFIPQKMWDVVGQYATLLDRKQLKNHVILVG
jgi:hypothetical protein